MYRLFNGISIFSKIDRELSLEFSTKFRLFFNIFFEKSSPISANTKHPTITITHVSSDFKSQWHFTFFANFTIPISIIFQGKTLVTLSIFITQKFRWHLRIPEYIAYPPVSSHFRWDSISNCNFKSKCLPLERCAKSTSAVSKNFRNSYFFAFSNNNRSLTVTDNTPTPTPQKRTCTQRGQCSLGKPFLTSFGHFKALFIY